MAAWLQWQRWSGICSGSLLVLFTSCGGDDAALKQCYPVSGQLFVRSRPAAGAMLFFQPQDGSRPEEWTTGFPRATVEADGSFEVATYAEADGAPAGDYVVLAHWPASTGVETEEEVASDRFRGWFMNPATSPLRAKVDAKATTLPRFDLK